MIKVNNAKSTRGQSLDVMKLIILLCLVQGLSAYTLLGSIDAGSTEFAGRSNGNFAGMSFYFDDIYPHFNNTLFRGYVNASRLNGNSFNLFHLTIHMPLGYKYNCSAVYYGDKNISCIFELASNPNVIFALKKFLLDFRSFRKAMIGFDVQQFNFTNPAYRTMMVQFFKHVQTDGNMQLMDRGDQLMQYYNNTVYTPVQFKNQMSAFQDDFYYNFLSGPGLSQTASAEWNKLASQITSDNSYAFTTFRIVLFKNQSEATIQNLMSQNYTADFLTRRFTFQGVLLSFGRTNVMINEVRLMEGMGLDGVTNSFAAAIWSIDFILSFAKMNGKHIDFFTTLNESYQSVLGSSPNFQPGPIYYGILMAQYCLADSSNLLAMKATGDNSQIKVYGCGENNMIILNKDTNPNSTGYVDITMNKELRYLSCVYMKAQSLNATSGFSIGGVYWVGNNSDFLGQYEEFVYYANTTNNVYQVNISYAQVAFCRNVLAASTGFQPLKRGRSQNYGQFLAVGVFYLVIMFVLAN